MEKPTGSPAVGAKQKIEKQARQLAYDTRYKVRQSLNKGTKLSPAEVSKAYMSQLAKSSAAPAVKARAKQMLLGEDLVDTKKLATDTIVSALYKVFVEGVEEVVEESDYLQQLNEMEDKKYKIRVTDKKTGNTYVRMATRSKIAELRANPNISSVEMTEYGEPTKSEKTKGSSTAKAKAGKGLDPVGQEDSDVNNDGKVNKTDKYLMKRRKAIGSAIATRKEDYDWKDGFAELIEKKKEESGEKKITGEGVNNSKLITVFPDDNKGIKEQNLQMTQGSAPEPQKPQPQKPRQNQALVNQILQAKQQVDTAQRNLAMKQRQAGGKVDLQSLSASYEPEGDDIQEVSPPGMEGTVKAMKKHKEIDNPYALAWWMKGRGYKSHRKASGAMKEETEDKKAKKEEEEVDPRSIPTTMSLAKNKLRARGIMVAGETPSPRNMKTCDDLSNSYKPEGEIVSEEESDRMRDREQERYGMDRPSRYRGGVNPNRTGGATGPKKKPDPDARKKALDMVKQATIAKYGKGSLM